jgi:hypothetical protein
MNENTHALIEQPGPSSLEYSPCPHCGEEVDWTAVPAHHCIGTLRAKRPTYDELALAGFGPHVVAGTLFEEVS